MKVRELKKALTGVDDNLEVVLRVQHTIETEGEKEGDVDEEDCVAIGGVTTAMVDAGCTEKDAFVIDGDEAEIQDEADDEDEEDEEEVEEEDA